MWVVAESSIQWSPTVTTPKIISVDDHILEPADLWTRYLPARFRDAAPRMERLRGDFIGGARGRWAEGDEGPWSDIWVFEDLRMPIIPGFAAAGKDQDAMAWEAMTYDDMRPG